MDVLQVSSPRLVKMRSMSAGMLSAAASLGMILLWDVDGGLTQIDKYLYSSEDYIKVKITLSFTYIRITHCS